MLCTSRRSRVSHLFRNPRRPISESSSVLQALAQAQPPANNNTTQTTPPHHTNNSKHQQTCLLPCIPSQRSPFPGTTMNASGAQEDTRNGTASAAGCTTLQSLSYFPFGARRTSNRSVLLADSSRGQRSRSLYSGPGRSSSTPPPKEPCGHWLQPVTQR